MEVVDAKGYKRRFVVDTGASSTFISANVLDDFDHHIVHREQSTATLANGSSNKTLGLAKVYLKLRDGRVVPMCCKILAADLPVGVGFIGCDYTSEYDILSSEMVLKHISSGFRIPIVKETISGLTEQEWLNFASDFRMHGHKKADPQEYEEDYETRLFDSVEGSLITPDKYDPETAQVILPLKYNKDFIHTITDPALIPEPLSESELHFDINPNLPCKIRTQYLDLLNEFRSVFVFKASEMGLFSGPEEYQIQLTSTRGQRGQHIPIPFHLQDDFKKHIHELLENGLIEPTTDTRYNHSFLAVRKKDGSTRWCSDMRAINAITEDDAFELPRIADVLQTLTGNKVYSSLDLVSCFNQFTISPENRDVYAFTDPTTNLRYRWKRCFFGLKGIPQFISYIMSNRVFLGKDPNECSVYIDDITCANDSHEAMIENLRDVLMRLSYFNLKLKLTKCQFGYTELQQFGFSLSEKGCTIAQDRMESLSKIQRPTTKKQLHSSIGAFGYFRSVLPEFARFSAILTPLISKDTPFLEWTDEAEDAWDGLVRHAQAPETLSRPDHDLPFIVTSDASEKYFGGMLTQEVGCQKRLIAVHSAHFPQNKYGWAIHLKELIALTAVVEKWHTELVGAKFKIRSDNSWVVRLLKYGNNVVYSRVGPAVRCIMKLSQYDYEIEHCPGESNKFQMADLLSRRNEPYFLDHRTVEDKTVGSLLRPLEPHNPQTFEYEENDSTPGDILCSIPMTLPKVYSRQEIRDFVFDKQNEYRDEIIAQYSDRKNFDEDELTLKGNMIVPQEIVKRVLEQLHRHCGIHREYALLKNCDIIWDGMATDIRQYVLSCESCSRVRKVPSDPKAIINPRIPLRPFESISIDINQCGQGESAIYVLGLIDHYSKFCLLKRVESPGIYHCLDTLLTWALEYNISECQLRADNAFRRDDFVEMCNILNIHCRFSVPGNSTSNAEIERCFRTVNEKFRLYNLAEQNVDVAISFIQAEINGTPITDCGVAPYEVIFGVTPVPSLLEPLPVSVEANLMKYAKSKYDRILQLSSFLDSYFDKKTGKTKVTNPRNLLRKGDKVRILVPRKPGVTKWAAVPYAKEVYRIIDVRRPTRTYLIEYEPPGRQPIRKLVHHNRVRRVVEFSYRERSGRSKQQAIDCSDNEISSEGEMDLDSGTEHLSLEPAAPDIEQSPNPVEISRTYGLSPDHTNLRPSPETEEVREPPDLSTFPRNAREREPPDPIIALPAPVRTRTGREIVTPVRYRD